MPAFIVIFSAAIAAWTRKRAPAAVNDLASALVRGTWRGHLPFFVACADARRRVLSLCLPRHAQAARLGSPRHGDAALKALQPWLAARGAVLGGATPAVFPESGLRGLAFTAAAPPDTVVLSVPLQATLSALTFSGAEHLRDAVAPGAHPHTRTQNAGPRGGPFAITAHTLPRTRRPAAQSGRGGGAALVHQHAGCSL
jgi:hypothetical protein